MDNQHQMIKGYRDLSQAEIDLINRIKAHGIATQALIADVHQHVAAQFKATCPPNEQEVGVESVEQRQAREQEADRLTVAEPFRWIAMAKTDAQTSCMALTRAVAQPSGF